MTSTNAEQTWHRRNEEKALAYLRDRAPNADRLNRRAGYDIAAVLDGYNQTFEQITAHLIQWNAGVFTPDDLATFTEYAVSDDEDRAHLLAELDSQNTAETQFDRDLKESIALWNRVQAGLVMPTVKKAAYLTIEPYADIIPDFSTVGQVEGLLDRGTFVVVYGDSGVGKSVLVMDMVQHIGSGQSWFGKTVEQGLVIYVAAEGPGSARKRVAALKKTYPDSTPLFALVPCSIDLSGRGADVQPLLDVIAPIGRPTVIVIDTLSRAMDGSNENDSSDMGSLVKNVERLRVATGATLILIHHSGKDAAKKLRGHSSLRAATDTVLEVLYDEKSGHRECRIDKQRDSDGGKAFGFALQSVPIGQDEKGRTVTAPIVAPGPTIKAGVVSTFTPDSAAGRTFTAIENLTMSERRTTRKAIIDEIERLHYPGKKKSADRAVDRGLNVLRKSRLLIEENDNLALSEAVETDTDNRDGA